MNRKGFPESYDTRRAAHVPPRGQERRAGGAGARLQPRGLRHRPRRGAGRPPARHPHPRGPERAADRPRGATEFVSDYFDFSIYIDAEESDIEQWYVERFLTLRRDGVPVDPRSYFRHFADLTEDEAVETAHGIWREINGKNLAENIAADARPGVVDHAQGRRPQRDRGAAPEDLSPRRSGAKMGHAGPRRRRPADRGRGGLLGQGRQRGSGRGRSVAGHRWPRRPSWRPWCPRPPRRRPPHRRRSRRRAHRRPSPRR